MEAESDSKVKVTSAFFDYYRRIFDQESAGRDACNLGKFILAVEKEKDATLWLLFNSDLLVSLARSQPKRLMSSSYSVKPSLLSWDEFLSRLQDETRLDFSDVWGKKVKRGRGSSIFASLGNSMGNMSSEMYRRFLSHMVGDDDFNISMRTSTSYSGRGQKVSESTPAPPRERAQVQVVDLSGSEAKEAPFRAGLGMGAKHSFGLGAKAVVPQREELLVTPYGTAETKTDSRMAVVSLTSPEPEAKAQQASSAAVNLSPENLYNSAVNRIDDLMRRREEKGPEGEGAMQVVDLVSSEEEEEEEEEEVGKGKTQAQQEALGGLMDVVQPGDLDSFLDVTDDAQAVKIAERLKPLTAAAKKQVEEILQGPRSQDVVIEKFNIDMTRDKICCLRERTWLNDEVINFYMCMLKERDTHLCKKDPNRLPSHFFNSFFMQKLLQTGGANEYNYAGVRRWSKKFDTFAMERVFVPINISNSHWTMLILYVQKKEIVYLDSMSGGGLKYLRAMRRWIVDEADDKKNRVIDGNEYTLVSQQAHVPQQNNGYDCGVFSVVNADFATEDLRLDYSQANMPLFRIKIAAAILRGHLDYPVD